MVYPQQRLVSKVEMPVLENPYYVRHNLFVPPNPKVADREAFGDHYGTVYFRGEDPRRMQSLFQEHETLEQYCAVQEQGEATPQ